MPVSGWAGGAALDALQQQFKQQLLEEQLAQRAEEARLENERANRSLSLQEQSAADLSDWRKTQSEQDERDRRDRANAAGVTELYRSGDVIREDEEKQRTLGELQKIYDNPDIPESTKAVFRAGGKVNDPEDFEDPAAVRKRRLDEFTEEERIRAQYRDEPVQPYVNEAGETVWGTRGEIRGRPVGSTAGTSRIRIEDRKHAGRIQAAQTLLQRMKELSEKIHTKIGPEQGVMGILRKGQGAIGLDPDVSEYERLQAAASRAIGVAALGAQGFSNADASAYQGMVPGPRTDRVTAGRLFEQLENMLYAMEDMPAKAPGEKPAEAKGEPKTLNLTRDKSGNLVPGGQ